MRRVARLADALAVEEKFGVLDPWLGLPHCLRQQLVNCSLRTATVWEVLEPENVEIFDLSSASQTKYSGTVEKVAMAIDWSAGTNDDIIEAIACWVRKSRPASFPSRIRRSTPTPAEGAATTAAT